MALARDVARENWGPIVRTDASAPPPADDPRKDGLSPYYYPNLQAAAATPSPAVSSSSNSSQMPAAYDTVNGSFPMDFSSELPVHTADLGRVPFHHGFSSHFDPRYSISQQHSLFPSEMQQQQQQTYYSDPLQQPGLASASIPPSLSNVNGGLGGDGMNWNSFGPFPSEMSLADYDQLLAAMAVPTAAPAGSSSAPQVEPQTQEQPAVAAGTTGADADVSMMFEDNMVEMWSSAPTSLA